MRTTVDLPDELHERTLALARSTGRSLSATLAALIESALTTDPTGGVGEDRETGLPLLGYGRLISSDDVAGALEE